MGKRRLKPWDALLEAIERLVLNVLIGLAVAAIGRQLRKRFR